jgi:hypothetical protein
MAMFWSIQRRPSRLARVVRSALVVGAAVMVPVGIRVIRRFMRLGAASSHNGRSSAASLTAPLRHAASRRARRKRTPAFERS